MRSWLRRNPGAGFVLWALFIAFFTSVAVQAIIDRHYRAAVMAAIFVFLASFPARRAWRHSR